MLAASQRGCMINAIDCMHSKLPPEDEQLIYSKHVEDQLKVVLCVNDQRDAQFFI